MGMFIMTQPFPGIASLFSSVGGSITISPYIILAIVGFFTLLGVILALLLEYHWKAYGIDKVEILRVRFWYYAGLVVFGSGMLISALLFVFLQ